MPLMAMARRSISAIGNGMVPGRFYLDSAYEIKLVPPTNSRFFSTICIVYAENDTRYEHGMQKQNLPHYDPVVCPM